MDKEKRDHDRRMTQAWTIAALQRTKKLPALDKLLTPKQKAQTPDEMRAALKAIFKHGGRKRKKQP